MTLIDKAEALAPCPFCGGGVSVTTTERVGGIVCDAPSECIGSGLLIVFDLEDMETALAAWNRRAIPARGVGVKPLVWEGDETELHDLVSRPDPFHTYTVRPLGELRFDVILNHELGSLWFRQRKGEIWPDYASAKAAAQADYEARILAALAPTDAAQARECAECGEHDPRWQSACPLSYCPHVNETPKSKHDAGNVLTAAQAPAEDAHVKGETAGQMLERLGMDGVKWAAEFRTTALRLGYSDMDEGWLIGWFCNAIMAGYDRSAAQAREAARRLRAYMDRRKRAHGFDQETVHTFGAGTESEANLTVSDLEAILALIGEGE